MRLALESDRKYGVDTDKKINYFFDSLKDTMDVVAKQLHDRYEFQTTATAKQFPLLMSGMWNGSSDLGKNDTLESVLKTGTLGIGFIGLAETLIVLTGKHHGESNESQSLGLKILTFMNNVCDIYKEKYKHNYSILATPAEGISGKFTIKDRKEFGVIEKVTDKDYYTNSNHVPVWHKCTVKHKAEVEAPYHDLTRGGHIFYVELDGDATHNPKSIMQVVDYMDKFNLGYGSINHTRSRCLECGFENADNELSKCPMCNSDSIDIIQRITGYLVGSVSSWNDYKKAELKDRVTHN